MNIIQFVISIHAFHKYKLFDGILNALAPDRNPQDSQLDSLSRVSTGPPSLESSQVNFKNFQKKVSKKFFQKFSKKFSKNFQKNFPKNILKISKNFFRKK